MIFYVFIFIEVKEDVLIKQHLLLHFVILFIAFMIVIELFE